MCSICVLYVCVCLYVCIYFSGILPLFLQGCFTTSPEKDTEGVLLADNTTGIEQCVTKCMERGLKYAHIERKLIVS